MLRSWGGERHERSGSYNYKQVGNSWPALYAQIHYAEGLSPAPPPHPCSHHVDGIAETLAGDVTPDEGTPLLQQHQRLEPLGGAVSHDPAAVTCAEREAALGGRGGMQGSRHWQQQHVRTYRTPVFARSVTV